MHPSFNLVHFILLVLNNYIGNTSMDDVHAFVINAYILHRFELNINKGLMHNEVNILKMFV